MKISALKKDSKDTGTRVAQVTGVSAKGPISAYVISPAGPATNPAMIAIHGISRNAGELVEQFQAEATMNNRVVIVPHFDQKTWPVFQRITGKHRPDLALLSLINTLRQSGLLDEQRISLFGYSGGAQLAHRFAMLFPELVDELHLGAAGWYTLPVPKLPYPLGIGPGASKGNWHLLMESSLHQFLERRIHVYVGSEDTLTDSSLRREPLLNRIQGDTRYERAERYVSLITHYQLEMGLPGNAHLEVLEGCGHDFSQCCNQGGMLSRIAATSSNRDRV
ncbi:alpha/beta hydrolase [Marinobacter halotolerans]|uniref:alpha/beta hydrolase n=1 Tax=Marinobacter halotolerans TaxID=1569211 RepID=UPI001248A202|nr:hypothetical protein [Marinobacter halotolerans]